MADWNTAEMSAALPDPNPERAHEAAPAAVPNKNPQECGWVAPSKYDYDTYNMSSKEQADAYAAQAAAGLGESGEAEAEADTPGVGGIAPGDWASNAAIYVWNDEYGDVVPRFPALEDQLFGSKNHVRTGINFERVNEIQVQQEGAIRIKPITSFALAGLHPVMVKNIELAGYEVPTPIQRYTIPSVIEGHDLVACAQTGSGKTAAFLIPILSKLMGKAKKLCAPRPNPATFVAGEAVRAEPLVLIIAPCRELATQIFDEARRFCYRSMLRPAVIYGGGPIAEQVKQLEKGCDVLIGTPGRLCDFVNRPNILTLRRLKYMVIDEADEMLNTEWENELKQIMSGGDQEEGNISYLMFSATFPKMALDLAAQHLAHNHVRIQVGRSGSSHANIKQDVIYVEPHAKKQALLDLLLSAPATKTIIFVNTKRTADEVDDFLYNSLMPCTSIHGDRTQREREDCIRAFRRGRIPILIATGVSARGLDIHLVLHVINFDLPSTQYGGILEYTHRIGRTGRIGNLGVATSFYNPSRDEDLAEPLVKLMLETRQIIPDFLRSYLPEGFTADDAGVVTGDFANLKFDEEGLIEEEGNADGGDAWGSAEPIDSSEAPAQVDAQSVPEQSTHDQADPTPYAPTGPFATQPPVQSLWGVRGAPAQAAQGAPVAQHGQLAPGFGAPAQSAQYGTSQGHGAVRAAQVQPSAPASNGNWAAPVRTAPPAANTLTRTAPAPAPARADWDSPGAPGNW